MKYMGEFEFKFMTVSLYSIYAFQITQAEKDITNVTWSRLKAF